MKNFTKQNFKTNPLWIRLLIMTFMLLAGADTAWAYNQSAVDLYFDNSEAQWDNCRVYIGHNKWLAFYNMSRVSGTEHLWKLSSNFNSGNSWNDATHWGFTSDYWDAKEQSVTKIVHTGDKKFTYDNTSTVDENAWTNDKIYKTNGTANVTLDNQTKKAYKITSSTKSNYTVTIESATGGTLTVKDYDNATVSNGASKIGLTVLKFSADASTGYTFKEVQINNGSSTTTISAANLTSQTYTLTSNVTITPVWEIDCTPPDAPNFGSESSAEYCYGDAVSFPTINGVTLKWYDKETGGNVVESPKTNVGSTSYYAAAVADCESTTRTLYTITIKTKPTVTLNPNENTVCSGVALEGITRYVEIELTEGSQISWYATEHGGDPLATSTPLMETSYFAEATLNGCYSDRAKFTITDVLSAPTEVPNVTAPETICDGESAVLKLNNKNANYTYRVNGEVVAFTNDEYTVLPTISTDYIVSVENKCGSLPTTKTITVTPLPNISISGSGEAVLYEDVTLTAEATDGATIKWYEDDVEKGEGLTYVVTSETATSKTITAKAFLNGCESEESYIVNFEAEGECEHEIITHTEKTKVRVKKISNWSTIKIYAHSGQSSGNWPGTNMTAGTGEDAGYYVYTFESVSSNFKVIFNNGSSNGENQTVSATATKGKVCTYTIGANSCSEDNNSRRCLTVTTSDYKTTGDVIITAPAVKTVSATSEEGSGIVTFTGKVLKTGCATGSAIWVGYQYKKADEEWPTTDVTAGSGKKQLATISNNPGSEDFTAEVNVENLEDGDYHFRAYVINGYGRSADPNNYDQGVYYGLDKLVTVRNTKTAIISVALQHADEYGKPILSTPTYCAGTTAYLLLTYVGSRPDVVNWSSTLSNTITKVDGNLYKFTVAGSETITVSAKNEENIDFVQGTIDVAAYSIPLTPMVELDKSEICSNDDDATITVTNAQDGFQYYLYETGNDEAVQGPRTGTGSLAFTKIKTAATYYVSAVNSNCPTYKVESQKRAITMIDASQNTIAIEPTTKTINPWGTVTLNVTKNSQYDYTLKCMQEDTDVTANLVINKKGDTYSIKFPKPSTANIVDGQVVFGNIEYEVTVTLDGSVQCGTTSATSEITLTQLFEDCQQP